MKITMCFKHLEASHIMSCDTKARLSDFKLGQNLFQFMRYKIKKNGQPTIQESLNLIAQVMNRFFFLHILSHHDLPLPIGSDETVKRLQMWLNNSQCGHKEGQKFPIFFVR